MPLLALLKRYTIDYVRFRFKSARIAAALQPLSRTRLNRGRIGLRDGAHPVEFYNDIPVHDVQDVLFYWEVQQKANLILKNNSSNSAYNIRLLNADAIFSKIGRLEKLASLAPNETLTIPVEFNQSLIAGTGQEADALPLIPADKQGLFLLIQYENESGNHMKTRFKVAFGDPVYEYTW